MAKILSSAELPDGDGDLPWEVSAQFTVSCLNRVQEDFQLLSPHHHIIFTESAEPPTQIPVEYSPHGRTSSVSVQFPTQRRRMEEARCTWIRIHVFRNGGGFEFVSAEGATS